MLEKFLKKIGVHKYEELNEEEKKTYRDWEIALAGRKVTEEDYKKFLEMELEVAIGRLLEEDASPSSVALRKAEVKLIKKVLSFMEMPMIEKGLLEKQLEQQM